MKIPSFIKRLFLQDRRMNTQILVVLAVIHGLIGLFLYMIDKSFNKNTSDLIRAVQHDPTLGLPKMPTHVASELMLYPLCLAGALLICAITCFHPLLLLLLAALIYEAVVNRESKNAKDHYNTFLVLLKNTEDEAAAQKRPRRPGPFDIFVKIAVVVVDTVAEVFTGSNTPKATAKQLDYAQYHHDIYANEELFQKVVYYWFVMILVSIIATVYMLLVYRPFCRKRATTGTDENHETSSKTSSCYSSSNIDSSSRSNSISQKITEILDETQTQNQTRGTSTFSNSNDSKESESKSIQVTE